MDSLGHGDESDTGASPVGCANIRKTLERLAFCYVFSTVDSKAAFVMSHLITFKVHGTPVGKGRPRISTRGGYVRSYTPERTRDWESHIADVAHREMMNNGLVPTYDAVRVELEFYFPVPKSYTKKKRQLCLADELKPLSFDIDNLCKSVLDGMNKVVYADDKQIFELHAQKLYTDHEDGFVKIEIFVE